MDDGYRKETYPDSLSAGLAVEEDETEAEDEATPEDEETQD
jgi:hypothetical protein